MKKGFLVIAFLALAAKVGVAQQPPGGNTIDTCRPQPDCRLNFTNLRPGAPSDIGTKAQGRTTAPKERAVLRDSLRIPKH
jgi:hypothetical protein